MKKAPPSISMNEIFAEMDKFRKTAHIMTLSPEQKEFLRRGRAGNRIVSFPMLARLWEKAGWGRITDGGLRNQYEKMRENGEL